MNQKYFIRYKLGSGSFRIYNNETGEITTMKESPTKYDFFVQSGYEASDEGLMEYAKDFKRWTEELYNNKVYKINYTNFHSHYTAVLYTFSNISKKKYSDHEPIGILEGKWIEACYNGSLQYCEPQTCQCYAYDFSEMYPSILTNPKFIIPTKAGREKTLNEIPTDLKTGYYRVKITCNNKDFNKLFSFSKQHVYTNISLNYAQIHQKKYDVNIELIKDGEPNTYVYDDTVAGSKIFSLWFYKMLELKKMFPKNRLVKHLFSSLHGHLIAFDKRNLSWKEIKKKGLKVGMGEECDYVIKEYHLYDDQDYYEVIDPKNPYKYNIRIKAFLAACARNKTAEVARKHLKHVVRIHTDCVVFNKKYDLSDVPFLVSEEKTSGLIKWKNVNSYDKKCKCGEWYHNTERKKHKDC